jgi:hypothetical protein
MCAYVPVVSVWVVDVCVSYNKQRYFSLYHGVFWLWPGLGSPNLCPRYGLSSPCTAATVQPIVPVPDGGDCVAVGGMRIGRGSRSTRRKPAPVPICSPQIPHVLTWAITQAAALGSRRLTA